MPASNVHRMEETRRRREEELRQREATADALRAATVELRKLEEMQRRNALP